MDTPRTEPLFPAPPLRIALVRQRHTPFGGAERILQQALASLSGAAELTLITRRWTEAPPGVRVVTCDPFHLGRTWRDWSFARGVCRLLDREPPDLVQSHERIPCCHIYRAGDGVHREWLRQRARAGGGRGGDWTPYHRLILGAEARLFASPMLRAVICNSVMVQQEIIAHFGLEESRLPVIYNGVDPARFHPGLALRHRRETRQRLAIPEAAVLFLLVGSGYRRKGVPQLLQALARLPREAHLVVVGHDAHAGSCQRLARRLGVAERVRFAGPQTDVTPYYGAADAVVLPTLYDPFPNVALEAMACALPLITSTKCGAAELIRSGDNGLVGDALDIDALSGHMGRLLDPEVRWVMGAAGWKSVESFTPQAMGAALLALYRRLLPVSGSSALGPWHT